MEYKEVINILKVTRQTLSRYVKQGLIKVEIKHNKRYIYNSDDVLKLINKNIERKIVIYGRVSTSKQKKDLQNQIQMLQQYCFSKGYKVFNIYQDIGSGISFEKRNQFFILLDEIINGKVERVIISYKDRISRVAFGLFVELFKRYDCIIEVMSEIGNEKLDSEEVFEEIVSMLHCYSMKMYSKRKNKNKLEITK